MKKENVMACILMELTGNLLINKGVYLTHLFNASLIVLYLCKDGERDHAEEQEIRSLANRF
ncbi:hypothetical protein ACW0TQ_08835 [Oceanobacillus sp. M60]